MRKQCSKGKGREECSESHIVHSVVYWGNNRGTLVIGSTVRKYTWQDCLLSYGIIEPIQQQCIICTIKHTIVFTEQRFMS
jgi:hypothetical protein